MNSLTALQTLNLANDVRVDSLQDGPSPWNFLVPNRNVLYYTFDASPGSEIDIETATSHVAFNTVQKSAVRSILTHVSQLIGVTFTEVATSAQADFHFAATNLYGTSNVSGLSSTDYSYSYLGDEIRSLTAESLIWLDNVEFAAQNNNPVAGSQGYETLLHEIGHAVGLGHPFEATADSPYNLPVAQDNTDNTVMSYTHAGDWKTIFQPYDALALTWIYGGDGLGGTWGYNSIQGNSLTPAQEPPPVLSKDDNYVVAQYASPAIVGAGVGDDTYLISGPMLPAGTKITISDVLGSNSLQLAPKLSLASFKVAASSLLLTLDTGAMITVLGADRFTYDVGGMTPAGIDNPDISYADFVRDTLGVTMPSGAGIVSGGALVLGMPMGAE